MKIPMITEEQYSKLTKFLPVPRGNKIIENRVFISCVIWVIKTGGFWSEIPEIYGKFDTIRKRFARWSKAGIFRKIFSALSIECGNDNTAMIDSTFSKDHRTACSLKSDGQERYIGKTKGGKTTKIHLLANTDAQPLDFSLTGGQVNDSREGNHLIEKNIDRINTLIADKAYDTNHIRTLLSKHEVDCCIPPKSNRKVQYEYDEKMYKQRHLIENMFAKLKDWLGIAFRRCRCGYIFDSFVCIGLIMCFFCVH